MKNYYEILEVSSNASFKDIRTAFRRLSKKYHPDINPGSEQNELRFLDVQEAYNVLKDGLRREEFDEQLKLNGLSQSGFKNAIYNIRNRFVHKRHTEYVDEDRDVYSQPFIIRNASRKEFYRGIAVLAISVLAIAAIFITESRLDTDTLTYKNEPLVLDTEPEKNPIADLAKNISQKSEFERKLLASARANSSISDGKKSDFSRVQKEQGHDNIDDHASLEPEPVDKVAEKEKNVEIGSPNPPKTSTSPLDLNAVYTDVDKKPAFEGGSSAFVQYLVSNLQYPPAAREGNVEGRVMVNFIVERDGRLSNISILQGIGGGCDEEALRVMKNAPAWLPGEHKGQKVRVQCTIPITFKLQ